MYETLTGKPPFVGSNPVKTIMKHLQDAPRPLRYRFKNLDLPPALELVVLKCLEKEPARRYQSAQELLSDLDKVQAGKPLMRQRVLVGSDNRGLASPKTAFKVFLVLFMVPVAALPLVFGISNSPLPYFMFTLPTVWFPLTLLLLHSCLIRLYKLHKVIEHDPKRLRSGDRWLLLFYQFACIDLGLLSSILVISMLVAFRFLNFGRSLDPLINFSPWTACAILLLVASPIFFWLIWYARRHRTTEIVTGW
jgi:serine/threonine protein kinase